MSCNYNRLPRALPLLVLIVLASRAHGQALEQGNPHIVMESYPNRIQAGVEEYRRQLESTATATARSVPYYIIVPSIQRWSKPDGIVRVAFNGGNDVVYSKIMSAASKWTQAGGASIQFVFKDSKGKFLQWNEKDKDYAAEVRVGFNSGAEGGYWSLVGTESATVGVEGGAPNQESLNLDGFDKNLPADWQSIVIHEFGHALGFQHEHQSPAGGCDFRFDDDPGYIPTKDDQGQGWYIVDTNGRRPGLYTYLGGYANFWPRTKVDANLRALPTSSAYLVGAFDKESIMKYFFDAFMFVKGADSPCYTQSENAVLSAQDLIGASKAYPADKADVAKLNDNLASVLKQVSASQGVAVFVRKKATDRLQIENLN